MRRWALAVGGIGFLTGSAFAQTAGTYVTTERGFFLPFTLRAGFGIIDVNQHILGVTGNDWAAAYQLRGGVGLGFNQKLVGSLEYRWTNGSKPSFSLAGIPTKLELDRHSFVVGINYKY